MKKVLIVFALCTSFLIQSQEKPNVNSFKYVVVPIKLDFLSEPDLYQTSSLSKFLLEKGGFKTYLSNEILPDDLSRDRCLALTANIQKKPAFLATKLYVELLDCRNNVVFKTDVFGTKEKKYTKAYREVLRKAFKPIQDLNYVYDPSNNTKENVVVAKKEKEKDVTPKAKKAVAENTSGLPKLTAKPIKNGFELLNSKSLSVYQILKTKAKDVFIIKGKNGTMYKEGNHWVAEFYNADNELVKKKYLVVF